MTVKELKNIMTKTQYENAYGTITKEYYFKDASLPWIQKQGQGMNLNRENPYSLSYQGWEINFKTLKDCLNFISNNKHIELLKFKTYNDYKIAAQNKLF